MEMESANGHMSLPRYFGIHPLQPSSSMMLAFLKIHHDIWTEVGLGWMPAFESISP
jgi:hypothetical protein